jgi:hypothetical protein
MVGAAGGDVSHASFGGAIDELGWVPKLNSEGAIRVAAKELVAEST